jgi:hypothetical protein
MSKALSISSMIVDVTAGIMAAALSRLAKPIHALPPHNATALTTRSRSPEKTSEK